LEEALAVIEEGKFGLAFGSGVAATDAVMKLLKPGDEVIAASDMYGWNLPAFQQDIQQIRDCFSLCGHECDSQH